jgi:hypothetical protein
MEGEAPAAAPAAATAPAVAPASVEEAPSAPVVEASTSAAYDWDSWTPDSEVPEEYRPGVGRVRKHYEEQMQKRERDEADIRAFLLGESEDNPFIAKSEYEKGLQRLRELEEQSSAWTKEKQDLLDKLSAAPDPETLRQDIRQEMMAEVLQYGESEGQKVAEAFASDYLDTLPPAEAEAKAAAAVELLDEGIDADVAFEAVKMGAEAFKDFKDLLSAGADPNKALAKAKEIDGRKAKRPSVGAQLTSASQKVSVLGNREEAEVQKPPPGSARESRLRHLGL